LKLGVFGASVGGDSTGITSRSLASKTTLRYYLRDMLSRSNRTPAYDRRKA